MGKNKSKSKSMTDLVVYDDRLRELVKEMEVMKGFECEIRLFFW